MKRNLLFALFALFTGVLSLCGIYFFNYFYPHNYIIDDTGEHVNVSVSENKSTFPVSKSTNFVIEYYYPEENRTLKEKVESIPAMLGLDKNGVEQYLDDYMDNLNFEEKDEGLVSYKMISYNDNEITLRKTYVKPKPEGYYAKSYNGPIVILNGDEKTVYEYTQISLASLPEDMRGDIINGYYLENEEALYSFLENYTS